MDDKKEIVQRNRIDKYCTLLLGMTALTIAWCSYQSNLWGSTMNFKLSEANEYYRDAQQNVLLVSQQQAIDAAVAINFLIAVVDNKSQQINYYKEKSKSDLAPIMKSWLALDPLHNKQAPPNPLEMDAYKQRQKNFLAKSDSANSKGDSIWKEAQNANESADRYTLLAVIFNLVMFFSAIAPKIAHIKRATLLVILAGIIFSVALILLIGFMPIA